MITIIIIFTMIMIIIMIIMMIMITIMILKNDKGKSIVQQLADLGE